MRSGQTCARQGKVDGKPTVCQRQLDGGCVDHGDKIGGSIGQVADDSATRTIPVVKNRVSCGEIVWCIKRNCVEGGID